MDLVTLTLLIGAIFCAGVFLHAMAFVDDAPDIRWYHIIAMIVSVAIMLFAMVLVGS